MRYSKWHKVPADSSFGEPLEMLRRQLVHSFTSLMELSKIWELLSKIPLMPLLHLLQPTPTIDRTKFTLTSVCSLFDGI